MRKTDNRIDLRRPICSEESCSSLWHRPRFILPPRNGHAFRNNEQTKMGMHLLLWLPSVARARARWRQFLLKNFVLRRGDAVWQFNKSSPNIRPSLWPSIFQARTRFCRESSRERNNYPSGIAFRLLSRLLPWLFITRESRASVSLRSNKVKLRGTYRVFHLELPT